MARQSLKNVMRLLDEKKQDVPVEQSFLADLKRSMEMESVKHPHKPSQAYKPSSMKCIRNMYYQLVGEPQSEEPMTSMLIGICNSGTDIHERVQKAVCDMKSNGMDCEYINVADYVVEHNLDHLKIIKQQGMETKLFDTELNMSFLCDGIIRYKDKYYILELKTESIYKWQGRKGVNPEHYNQGIAYATTFRMDNVIFVYINRDMLDMKAFMFNVTDEMKQGLVDKIRTCDKHVALKEVPPMPIEKSPKFCQYCRYQKSCKRDS